MGQHVGFNDKSNVLRRRLSGAGVVPDACEFHRVAHGPILPEAESKEEHRRSRNVVAEKGLADAMRVAGYRVMNDVQCAARCELVAAVRAAFRDPYPQLV